MIETQEIGDSQYHERFHNEAKSSCAFSAVTYMILSYLYRGGRTIPPSLLRDVVPFARIRYGEFCRKQNVVGFDTFFSPIEIANELGISEAVEDGELGGYMIETQTSRENFGGFESLSLCLRHVTDQFGSFFAVLTIGASCRAIVKDGNVFRLFDSHGSFGNNCFEHQSFDRAVCVKFSSLDELLACLFGFREYNEQERFNLLYLKTNPATEPLEAVEQRLRSIAFPTIGNARSTTGPVMSSNAQKTYAAAVSSGAVTSGRDDVVTVPRVAVLPR